MCIAEFKYYWRKMEANVQNRTVWPSSTDSNMTEVKSSQITAENVPHQVPDKKHYLILFYVITFKVVKICS